MAAILVAMKKKKRLLIYTVFIIHLKSFGNFFIITNIFQTAKIQKLFLVCQHIINIYFLFFFLYI